MNQRELCNPAPMRETDDEAWVAFIPGSEIVPEFDLMYYVEAIDRLANGAIAPDMDIEPSYVVVPVERPPKA